MNFLQVIFVIGLIGFSRSQLFEAQESNELFYDDVEESTTQIPDSALENEVLQAALNESAIDPLDHRFVGGAPSPFGASCAIAIYTISRTVAVKDKFKGTRYRVALKPGSLINAALLMDGRYMVTKASLLQNQGNVLDFCVKGDGRNIIRVSNVFYIDGTDIAVLKLCRKITRVPSCNIPMTSICPTNACSSIPPNIQSYAFRSRMINKYPEQTITQLQGVTTACPTNITGSSCCFTSSQIPCDSDVGGPVVDGTNLLGILTDNYNCQAQSSYRYTPVTQFVALKIYYAVSISLGCENCANLGPRVAQRI